MSAIAVNARLASIGLFVVLGACASRWARADRYASPNYLGYLAVASACPLPGLPGSGLRAAIGAPTAVESTSSGALWRYRARSGRPALAAEVADDTVRSWILEGQDGASSQAWARDRGCPQPGMSVAEVRTAMHGRGFGEPARTSTAPSGQTHLSFLAGREGQTVVFVFRGDALEFAQYCEGLYQVGPCAR